MISDSGTRQRKAAAALATYGAHRSDHQRLAVRCQHGHHVAFVYDTSSGPVYWAITGPHAHGSRDFVDTPHHAATRGSEYVDLLHAGPVADDALPAWCDCGPRSLSRAELAQAIADERRTIHLP